MNGITILVVIAAAGAAIALFNGILSMAYGGEAADRVNSTKHMFKRVAWQGVAVLLILAALLVANF